MRKRFGSSHRHHDYYDSRRELSTGVAFIAAAGIIIWRWLETRNSLLLGSFLNGL